jgi:hypothetical protein
VRPSTPELAAEPFPLAWPAGTPRSTSRKRSPYQATSITNAVRDIRYRLAKMRATSIVISSNIPLRRDGQPNGSTTSLHDPGVAVYFVRNGRDSCIACDAWISVGENFRAVARVVALGSIERTGSAQLVDAAFSGFARLPAQAGPSVSHWTVVLGITEPTTNLGAAQRADLLRTCEAHYRELARKCHPDAPNGSHAAMLELNRAIAEARKDLA